MNLLRLLHRNCSVSAGRILDQQFDLAAENAVLGIDLVEGELSADQFVFAERGIGPGQRIIEADFDRLVGERLHHERACHLHCAERKAGFEYRPPLNGDADEVLGHYFLPEAFLDRA